MQKYLTIGPKKITNLLFKPIIDPDYNSVIKPNGGLWLTEYDSEHSFYNPWASTMLDNRGLLVRKSFNNNYFNHNGCVVTLTKDANIFYLDTKEKLEKLLIEFPASNNGFSYEKLSKHYDGIYIDIDKLRYDIPEEFKKLLIKLQVNSLILFNASCIDYYQEAQVIYEPFDLEDDPFYLGIGYEIKVDSSKYKVSAITEQEQILIDNISKSIYTYLKENDIKLEQISNSQIVDKLTKLILMTYKDEIEKITKECQINPEEISYNLVYKHLSKSYKKYFHM